MRPLLSTLLILGTYLFLPAIAHGQMYIGLHGGVTLPSGYYAESRMSDHEWMLTGNNQLKAGAGKGFFGGLDISFPMPFHTKLEAVLTAEYLQGNVNADIQNYYQRVANKYSNCDQYELILPRFQNIPVLLGLHYNYRIGTYYDLYGEVLAGVNFRKITPWQQSYSSSSYTDSDGQTFSNFSSLERYKYDDATTFAFRIGAGILIRKLVTVGASYTVLGKAPLQWDYTRSGTYNTPLGVHETVNTTHVTYADLNPTMVCVVLGFRINPFKGLRRHVQDY